MKRSEQKLQFAKELRQKQTAMEQVLWKKLRTKRFHGLKFRRQVPLGPYIADFYCSEKKLVLEVDGWIHAYQQEYDKQREEYLRKQGYNIVRVENSLVRNWLSVTLEKIGKAVGIDYEDMEASSSPSP